MSYTLENVRLAKKYGIIHGMETSVARIKVPTTGAFYFPRLIQDGKGKYIDGLRGQTGPKACTPT